MKRHADATYRAKGTWAVKRTRNCEIGSGFIAQDNERRLVEYSRPVTSVVVVVLWKPVCCFSSVCSASSEKRPKAVAKRLGILGTLHQDET